MTNEKTGEAVNFEEFQGVTVHATTETNQGEDKAPSGVLGMDRDAQREGVRPNLVQRPPMVHASADVDLDLETANSPRNENMSQMRQSEMPEAEAFIPGNSEGQYAGRGSEGQSRAAPECGLSPGAHPNAGESLVQQKGNGTVRNMPPTAAERGSQKALPSLEAEEGGRIVGASLEEQWRLARIFCASKLVPKAFDSPEKVFTAVQFALQLGLKNPLVALRNICVVNGIPNIWGDLPLSLVLQSGQLKRISEFIFDKEGKPISLENKNLSADPFGASCTVERAGFDPLTTYFTMEDAKKACLLGKDTWKGYPKRMMQMRARTQALKDRFPDVLGGVPVAEYDSHIDPGSYDRTEAGAEIRTDAGSRLNQSFAKPATRDVVSEVAGGEKKSSTAEESSDTQV